MNEQQRAQVKLMVEQGRESIVREVPNEHVRNTANLLCLAKTAGDALVATLARAATGDREAVVGAMKAVTVLIDGLAAAAADLTLARDLNPSDVKTAMDKMLAISEESTERINAYIGTVRGSDTGPKPTAPGSSAIN